MIWSFLYFLFPSSAILFYGIGTTRAIIVADSLATHTLCGIKSIMAVVSSTILTALFSNAVLAPIGLSEFFPMVALLVFLAISILLEVIIRITTKQSAAEFTVSFLAILLAVGEATNFPESIFISLSCIGSFYILSFFIFLIKRRVAIANTAESMTNSSLAFLTMALLIIILCVINVSYLNQGVLK